MPGENIGFLKAYALTLQAYSLKIIPARIEMMRVVRRNIGYSDSIYHKTYKQSFYLQKNVPKIFS